MESLFKNLVINLQAKGPAAVLIALILSITALGLFGEGVAAGGALGILSGLGAMIVVGLTQKIN